MTQRKLMVFQSIFAEQMKAFILTRQLSGSDYHSQIALLWYFDQFLVKYNFNQSTLCPEIYQQYRQSATGLAPRSLGNRLSVIRQFCLFLAQTVEGSFIPEPEHHKKNYETYIPYIFTPEEIKRLLTQAKALPGHNSPIRAKTFYTLLGLLYTTGLRVGEARALNLSDYFKNTQRLHIRQGKFRKERWVCLSASTGKVLDDYLKERKNWSTVTPDSPFFISLRKNRISYSAIIVAFNTVLKQCSINAGNKQHKPHLQDVRHSFAVQRLTQWYQQGIDINAHLPALSTHMGHVNIMSTQVYLHTTPQLLALVNENFHRWFLQRIHNGGNYEHNAPIS